MQHLYTANTLDEMCLMATEVTLLLPQHPIVLLQGELGSGKTTLAQMICKILGITEPVTSPTYTLVNEYELLNHRKVYHFDLYRLQKKEELDSMGFYEYIDSGNICLIEWPQIAKQYLKDIPYLQINIFNKQVGRKIEINFNTQIA